MNKMNRFVAPLALGSALALPLFAMGCSGDDNPLCCTEFKAGATIDANIGGSVQSQIAVQAVADFAGIASAAISDITTACQSMAESLEAPEADRTAAAGQTEPNARMNAWCDLAVSSIVRVKAQAGGSIRVNFEPPRCQASFSAKANCQASCSVEGGCDVKATPPQCSGSLEVSCKGECKAKAGVALKCEGSCTGSCEGSCTAQGGVECAGKCQGTCKGAAQGGTGEGIQADGSCQGTCEGTCEVTAPSATCSGSCSGTCSASCTGSAEASVTCNGECAVGGEPLKCEGGEFSGGCEVDAKCDANCNASVNAKAECTPPSIAVDIAGAANVEVAGKLKAVFEANLGVILAFRARLDGMIKATGQFTANIDAVTDIKAACIPVVILAVGDAVGDAGAAFEATGKIAGSIN